MGKLSQNPLQAVVLGVILNFDDLYLQAQILSSNTTHELSGARFLAQSDESCKFGVGNKRLPPLGEVFR